MFHMDTQAGRGAVEDTAMLANRQAETIGRMHMLANRVGDTATLVAGILVEVAQQLSLKALYASWMRQRRALRARRSTSVSRTALPRPGKVEAWPANQTEPPPWNV